jgi:hypothetical protein
MSADPNKKSARTFQCRDVLWETFEQMARELECSVDYLINEAMKQYARQRNYGAVRTPNAATTVRHPVETPSSSPGGAPSSAPVSPNVRSVSLSGALPVPPAGAAHRLPPPPPGRTAPPPPPPARSPSSTARPVAMVPPLPRSSVGPPPSLGPPTSRPGPPPLPRGHTPIPSAPNGFPVPGGQLATLSLVYQGERYPVTKDRFVIGRGKQSSDLTLKDPNVSRQHAMVEFQSGAYFMVDMGSTNGVEFNGQRIARKQIGEGDVFRICDHEIFFTYR